MSSLSAPEFADKVSEAMAVIYKEFMKQQASEFYKLKVTVPQLAILEFLHRAGEASMSDMAHNMNVTTAAMTGIIDRLVRDGYVGRLHDEQDRRVIRIKLTAKGNSIVKSIIEKKRHLTTRIFSTLSHSEREEYLKILNRIREGLSS
jgi:DNA-binding MarR family transcriptional regulator